MQNNLFILYIVCVLIIRYNIQSATLFGRRLVLHQRTVTSDYIDICLQKSTKGGLLYAYNGTVYSHHQPVHYLLCSWLYRWF